MKEKVLDNKKNGMGMMVLFILLYAVAAAAVIFGAAFEQIPLMVIGIIWASLGWIPFLGLKVLKPQEALVLTLFGKYVGTLKNDGFYWVNPFCTAVNPAAKTRLNQSGDVDGGNAAKSVLTLATGTSASTSSTYVNKKISLKIMTLNNNRQKIINNSYTAHQIACQNKQRKGQQSKTIQPLVCLLKYNHQRYLAIYQDRHHNRQTDRECDRHPNDEKNSHRSEQQCHSFHILSLLYFHFGDSLTSQFYEELIYPMNHHNCRSCIDPYSGPCQVDPGN